MKPRIILVEDDPYDADEISEQLKDRLGASIDVIRTEKEFLDRLPEIAKAPPDLIVMDVMLRWTFPSPDLADQPIPEGGFYTAGLRCVARLESDAGTKNIPFILYTGLSQVDITRHIVTTKSNNIGPLIEEIKKILD